jgi:hypothetical protein
MIKTQELAGPSCLTAAADDEPLFVLRANDELAPEIVRRWAYAYYNAKGGQFRMTPPQLAKCDEAFALARAMERWHEIHHPNPPSTETAA